MSTSVMSSTISDEQVQTILDHQCANEGQYSVAIVRPVGDKALSHVPSMKIYLLDLTRDVDGVKTEWLSFLTIYDPSSSGTNIPHNSLPVVASIINSIRELTPLPLSPPLLDTSLSVIPYEYLITTPVMNPSERLIPLSEAPSRLNLSPQQVATISLKVGQLLGRLHSLVMNDWYGQPIPPSSSTPQDPSYNWQETFVSMFEAAMERGTLLYPDILTEEIRGSVNQLMSRAIAFFLFDDVSVPSLIWFTGSPTDVYLTLKDLSDGTQSLELAAVLPSLGHAVWGDPLLETFFMEDPPDAALLEGYVGGGGEPQLTFPRQKTKRLWYTLYLAVVVLCDQGDERKSWAEEMIKKSVKGLEGAPNY